MDSCWVEVNHQVSEALRVKSERSDDPRFLLVEVVRALLEHALADRQTVSFLISHFHYTVSAGSDEKLAADNWLRLDAYREYRQRIDELCRRSVAHDPGLLEAGVTQSGLCHLTLSLVYGVIGGWYLSEQDPAVHGHPVSLEDALAVLRRVVYVNGS